MNYNNLAQLTNFIGGSSAFENVPFYITSLNIPGLNLSHSPTGGRGGTSIVIPGNTVEYSPLSITMLIDEDFEIYRELMSIIRKNINVENSTYQDFYFDFFIQINNNKGNRLMKMDLRNCRLESISDIELNTQDDATEYSLNITLLYDYYTFETGNPFTLVDTE